jgi:hypothetical protein
MAMEYSVSGRGIEVGTERLIYAPADFPQEKRQPKLFAERRGPCPEVTIA